MEVCKRTDSEKSSHRRLPISSRHALLALLFVGSAVWAQPASNGDAAAGFATLDAFLGDVHSLTAEFRQELWAADQHLLQTETGTLSLRRPNRFRWIYREPTELTIVADGARLWIYDIELAQVTVAPIDATVESSPAMLLSGDRSVRDDFDVVQTYTQDGLDWVKLEPKTAGADFTSVLIGFSGAAPQRIELVDGLNQLTRIEFTDLTVNPVLDDAVFEFEPPAGVDVIGGDG